MAGPHDERNQDAPPIGGQRTPEQIAEDMKQYARRHRYHGGLHQIDKEEALRTWNKRRAEEVPAVFAEERSGEDGPEDIPDHLLLPADAPSPAAAHCGMHPDADSPWLCTDCGARFCRQCVHPLMSFLNTRHGGYEYATAVCPRCKGRCVDRRFEAEKRARIEAKEAGERKDRTLRTVALVLFSAPFLVNAVRHYDGISPVDDLFFLLFVFAVLNFGFLRGLDIYLKSFFVRVLPGFAMLNLVMYVLLLLPSKLAHVLFGTPLKYAVLSGWCAAVLFGVERTVGLFGHIYRGSQEPEGLTTAGRYLLATAVAVVVLSALLLAGAVIMRIVR